MSMFLFTGITNLNTVHAETSVNDVLDSLVDELEEKSKEELISSELEDLSEEDLHSLVNLLKLYLLKYIEKEYFTMTGIILLTLGILIFSISLFEYLDKHLDGEETMFSKICMGFGFIIFVLSYFV